MLGQIELGKSAPTVNVLWKIARALEVSMSVMVADRTPGAGLIVPVEKAKSQLSRDGTVASRPLFPKDVRRSVEFFETRLASGAIERHDPHPPCTRENLVVSVGAVEIDINGKLHMLGTGDAILFDSDVPHVYRNTGANEALIYVVITYCDAGR